MPAAHQIPLIPNTIGTVSTPLQAVPLEFWGNDMHKYFHLKIGKGVVLGRSCGYNNRHGL